MTKYFIIGMSLDRFFFLLDTIVFNYQKYIYTENYYRFINFCEIYYLSNALLLVFIFFIKSSNIIHTLQSTNRLYSQKKKKKKILLTDSTFSF